VLILVAPYALFAVLDAALPLPVGVLERLDASPVVTMRDGRTMHVGLRRDEQRLVPTGRDQLSEHLLHAAVASEDRRFLSHRGVDAFALFRAAGANATGGGARQGASTITMQLARLLSDTPRTLVGKCEQTFRALQLERRYGKVQILAAYLERVPFGGNLLGAGAAARAFFGKSPRDLTAAEAALLVSVLPAPGRLAPSRDPAEALVRRDRVLDRMFEEGYLEAGTWRAAKAAPLGLQPTAFPDLAPHAWLRVGEGRSSIDPHAQRAVESIARAAGGVDGLALVLVENETCAIRALVGARNADVGRLDATGRPRSAGSTFKPFLYALAFDLGYATPETRLSDLPWRARDWTPQNFDRAWRGPVPVAEALASSYNLPAVRLAASLPPGTFAGLLRRAGCRHVRPPGAGAGVDLALGTDDVTPLELAGAYAALARGGLWRAPWIAERDAEATESVRICSRGAASLVTRILADPTRARPAGAAHAGIAWKTGTSSRRRDAWAAGYTQRFTAVAWRGRLDGRPDDSLVGARAATPLLIAALQAVDPSPAAFPVEGVVEVEVCAETGLAATEACGPRRTAWRPVDARPLRACDVHRMQTVDAGSGEMVCEHCRSRPGRELAKRAMAVHSPAVALWRARVGLEVPEVPAHSEDCLDPLESAALRPLIATPCDGQVLAPRGEAAEVAVRVLSAQPDREVRLLLDGEQIAVIRPGTPTRVAVPTGRHTLTALTDRGHTHTVTIEVR